MDQASDTDRDDRPWRPSASGASFVYVFPRPGEDLLKLGMSRDPLARLQQLHRRWYEFFDLDAGWIVATDRVREARRLETRLSGPLAAHSAPAPLTVLASAGGATEWYRGASERLGREADSLQSLGYTLHRPLRSWLAPRLAERAPLLYHWSEHLLDEIEALPADARRPPLAIEWTLRHGLDALTAFGLALDAYVSPRVMAWHRESPRRLGA